jgi:hypothetical protein
MDTNASLQSLLTRLAIQAAATNPRTTRPGEISSAADLAALLDQPEISAAFTAEELAALRAATQQKP